jgi:diadenosine tetraphosphate (Ap4A) HIT family hydrolase
METTCFACRLTAGDEPLPGGRIWATDQWAVEHCVGPLGVGALIVKPLRHCLHLGDLTPDEAQELGPLLQRVSRLVQDLTQADQVYACLWSHANWQPVHIHFVVQPVHHEMRETAPKPGPALQAAMFQDGHLPDAEAVEAFCQAARERLTLNL